MITDLRGGNWAYRGTTYCITWLADRADREIPHVLPLTARHVDHGTIALPERPIFLPKGLPVSGLSRLFGAS